MKKAVPFKDRSPVIKKVLLLEFAVHSHMLFPFGCLSACVEEWDLFSCYESNLT